MEQYQLLSKSLSEIQHGNYQTGIETLSTYIDSLSNEAQEERKVAIRLRMETNLKVGNIDEVKHDIMLLNSIPMNQKDKKILLEMIRTSFISKVDRMKSDLMDIYILLGGEAEYGKTAPGGWIQRMNNIDATFIFSSEPRIKEPRQRKSRSSSTKAKQNKETFETRKVNAQPQQQKQHEQEDDGTM